MKPVSVAGIEKAIFMIRGQKVMLDSDLAMLYGVTTKRLNEQVRRNATRFPADFMFQLDEKETSALRSQFATSKKSRGGRRYLPYVFTEQGVAMLSSVLHSERAIQVNIAIMRVFVELRGMLSAHRELAAKLELLENRIERHDEQIHAIFEAIRQLMTPPASPTKKIGFELKEPKAEYGNE
jgi:hypothetical protein